MKIEDLILEILKKGVSIDSVVIVDDMDTIGYRICGFSKSGTVTLFQNSIGEIWASARYNETTQISNFNDLVSLAWDWFMRYKDRKPFDYPDSNWLEHFIERGWIEEQIQTIYKITK